MNNQHDFRYVVAIDFGTSRSGYAWARRGYEEKIYTYSEWPELPNPYEKTFTHLFYSPDQENIWWGAEAINEQIRRADRGDSDGYFFQRFKMDLFDAKTNQKNADFTFHMDPELGPCRVYVGNGNQKRDVRFYTVDLIAEYIKRLKDFILKEIKKTTGGNMEESKIRWVLTVPANSKDNQKRLMRKAAIKAGLISRTQEDHDRLILALEPEAAAFYCNYQKPEFLEKEHTLLVVDCGGGTVDVTAHRFDPHRALFEELATGKAENAGSTYLDHRFIAHYLPEILGSEAISEFKNQDLAGYHQFLLQRWEKAKCSLTAYSESVNVELGDFYLFLRENYPASLEQMKDHLFGRKRNNLTISIQSYLQKIALPVFNSIVEVVDDVLRRMPGSKCDVMYIVGGFALSPHLQDLIKNRFKEKVGVFVSPPEPHVAVMAGAVRFGLNPERLRRRTRWTYGFNCNLTFDASMHEESRKYFDQDDGIYRCKDAFYPVIFAGTPVSHDEVKVIDDIQAPSGSKEVIIKILASPKGKVIYADEDHVIKLSEIKIPILSSSNGKAKPLRVCFHFGKTEVVIEAEEIGSHSKLRTTADFAWTFNEVMNDEW